MNDFENRNRNAVHRDGSYRTHNPQMMPNGTPSVRRVESADRVFSERREAPSRPASRPAGAPEHNRQSGYRSDINRTRSASASREGYRRSSGSGASRTSGNRHTKRYNKKYTLTPFMIMMAVSVFLALSIIVGIFVNYQRKIGETSSVEDEVGTSQTSKDQSHSVSQTVALYSLNRSEVEPELDFPKVKIFDGQGRVVFSPIRNKDGKIEGTLVYEYDEGGQCIVEKRYASNGTLLYKHVSGGKKSETAKTLYEIQYDGKNNFSGYTETLLDANGVVIEKVQCSYNGVVEGKFYYDYDESGRVIRENRYSTYDELSTYTDYEYDVFGNVVSKTQRDSSGKEVIKDVMKYDDQNRIVLEEHYTVGVRKSYTEYSYDSDGSVIKKSYMLKDEYTMTYVEVQ